MTHPETDRSLLSDARALLARAVLDGFADDGIANMDVRPLDLGLSSDLFTVHPHSAAGEAPVAVVKFQRGFSAKVHAEAGALEFLGQRGFDATPRVLHAEPSHDPPALVLTWLDHDETSCEVDLERMPADSLTPLMREFGAWLARLHATEVPEGQVKMSSDPLDLPDRLLTQAQSATERFARRFGEEHGAIVTLLNRACAHLEDQLTGQLPATAARRMIHRDLRPSNVLASASTREFVGVVDFEHAAAADPAWDFAKLRWWWFDRAPSLEAPFREGYESERAWPDTEVRRLFRIFEATTLVAYFFERHPVYPRQALLQLRAELDGSERPRWTDSLG